MFFIEGTGLVRARAVDHHMGQPDRNRLPGLDRAVPADLDIGADLDGAALVIEEPEPVTPTRGQNQARFALYKKFAKRVSSSRSGTRVVARRRWPPSSLIHFKIQFPSAKWRAACCE